MNMEIQSELSASMSTAHDANLSLPLISLLKGVVYRENDPRLWSALLDLQSRIRDYLAVLGIELALDEAEGYAFLVGVASDPETEGTSVLPRLIARRPLSFPVSLLLALLRKKLAEFDAGGGDTRLILTRENIVELIRVFRPESSNEAKLVDQIDTSISKVVDLGYLRRLKSSDGSTLFEVRRIIKAFVDGHWLSEFDAKLETYRALISSDQETPRGERPNGSQT